MDTNSTQLSKELKSIVGTEEDEDKDTNKEEEDEDEDV